MEPPIDILMYHSVSDRGGPTSIRPEVFAAQMRALSLSGRQVVGMDALVSGEWPEGAVVLTFDDAFQDFITSAWPVLEQFGFPSVVYVPTGFVGSEEGWVGAMSPPRRLMDWSDMRHLSDEGVVFGSHTVSHPDLPGLDHDALLAEITQSKDALENELGRQVLHFAPPYGRSNAEVQAQVSTKFRTSVGTRLGRASSTSDLHDLPRLEMFYFNNLKAWNLHLEGHGGPYLALRKGLRAVRNLISHPSGRA